MVTQGMRGPSVMVAMPGDFWRLMKIIGVVISVFLSIGRFATSEPLPFFFGILAGLLAIVAIVLSISRSSRRQEFVAANEFTEIDNFRRQTKSMHVAEVVAGVIWVTWLAVSLGQFDWLFIGLTVATLLFAFARRNKLTKMSQPRNVWEK